RCPARDERGPGRPGGTCLGRRLEVTARAVQQGESTLDEVVRSRTGQRSPRQRCGTGAGTVHGQVSRTWWYGSAPARPDPVRVGAGRREGDPPRVLRPGSTAEQPGRGIDPPSGP